MKAICKQYGLNYFGPGYWRGISYAQNYTMHLQYLSEGILEIVWAPSHIY
jgi:hypothetical protein